RDIINTCARAVAKGDLESPIARHHILVEQRLNCRRVVPHDGGRDDFFHVSYSSHLTNSKHHFCAHARISKNLQQHGVWLSAILSTRCWADHRSNSQFHALEERRDIDAGNFADKTDIDLLAFGAGQPEFAAGENIRPGKPARFSSQAINCLYDFRVDLRAENL